MSIKELENRCAECVYHSSWCESCKKIVGVFHKDFFLEMVDYINHFDYEHIHIFIKQKYN